MLTVISPEADSNLLESSESSSSSSGGGGGGGGGRRWRGGRSEKIVCQCGGWDGGVDGMMVVVVGASLRRG